MIGNGWRERAKEMKRRRVMVKDESGDRCVARGHDEGSCSNSDMSIAGTWPMFRTRWWSSLSSGDYY